MNWWFRCTTDGAIYEHSTVTTSTMMQAPADDEEAFDRTRRCLFPAVETTAPDTSFESELDSTAMIQATDPNYLEDDCDSVSKQQQQQRHSPTGVSDYAPFESLLLRKEPLHSTIVMGEDGAEVTLGNALLTLVTPEKSTCTTIMDDKGMVLGKSRNHALMDVDWTPTPPPSKQKTLMDVWCGQSSANCIIDDTYEMSFHHHHHTLEQVISSFLGEDESSSSSPMNCYYDWQEWSFSFDNHITHQEDDATIESIRLNLRKRVLNLKKRKTRVHQLRRDLSPFSRSPARLVRSRSFSVSEHASAIVRQSTERRSRRSSFSHVLQLCTLPENTVSESPMVLRYNNHAIDGDVCYDSDPEDFARRRSSSRPQPSPTNCNKENYGVHYPSTIMTKDALDEFSYSNAVQEFLNRTSTLVYHPTKEGTLEPSSPMAVDAWLERGQRLIELIQPKWMWRPKPRYQGTGSFIRGADSVRSLELLDITRILKVSRIDRNIYPFAKPCNTFLVRNIEGTDFCFEAQSEQDRDLIVYSLKLVIARFGAMVLASNQRVYEEFFVSDRVPGGPPNVMDLLTNVSCDSEDSEC